MWTREETLMCFRREFRAGLKVVPARTVGLTKYISNVEGGFKAGNDSAPPAMLPETRAQPLTYCAGLSPEVREPVLIQTNRRPAWYRQPGSVDGGSGISESHVPSCNGNRLPRHPEHRMCSDDGTSRRNMHPVHGHEVHERFQR